METTVNNIWVYVQLLNPSADEALSKFQAYTICEQIQIWCNISIIPTTLERTIANWIVDYQKNVTIDGANSIKEGDTTISFADEAVKTIDKFAVYFKDLLYRYREVM